MPSPTQITVSQLSRLVGLPDCPTILDVRVDEDFAANPRIIPGAVRHPFDQVASLSGMPGGSKTVVVCHKGLKLSQGAAAQLRVNGIAAETLEGGMVAWQEAGEPSIAVSIIPAAAPPASTVWVTRQRPKVDRIACSWLIRRFIDRNAQFLFVEPSQVMGVAERFGATPFDVDGVFWSHRGEKCTFDTMVEEFGLQTPALEHLAVVVRAADTDRHDLAPQAAGLLAKSLGLSRMFRDDLAQLDAGISMYDALYRWARDAHEEGHDWPNPTRSG
jgi:rhodanese-related sulfurtransferase